MTDTPLPIGTTADARCLEGWNTGTDGRFIYLMLSYYRTTDLADQTTASLKLFMEPLDMIQIARGLIASAQAMLGDDQEPTAKPDLPDLPTQPQGEA